jgi:FixJ family two-component response regulator
LGVCCDRLAWTRCCSDCLIARPDAWNDRSRAPQPDGPACLVLDVRLPGQSGLNFQRELVATSRQLPIIFITTHGDIRMSVQAMKGGAIEFLAKPFRDQELLDAIQLSRSCPG